MDQHWRGKAISDVAFRNEQAIRERLASERSQQEKAARLNLEGVSALNHNEPQKATDFFRQAYQLDPYNAFSLNNMGYLAETQGDEETAADFYDRARRGDQAGTAVSVASRHEMVGEAAGVVADTNSQAAGASLQAQAEMKRRQRTPIVLRKRDNSPITGPSSEENQGPQTQPSPTPDSQQQKFPRPPMDNAPVENDVPRPPQ